MDELIKVVIVFICNIKNVLNMFKNDVKVIIVYNIYYGLNSCYIVSMC